MSSGPGAVRRTTTRRLGLADIAHHVIDTHMNLPLWNRPISVYGLGEMLIQSYGQSVSARRRKRCTETGLLNYIL